MNDIKNGFMQALRDFEALFALPTWTIVRCVLPFVPEDHLWHARRFGLADWARGRTYMTKWFDALMWLYIVLGLALFAV